MQVHYNLLHDATRSEQADRSRAVLRLVPAAGSTLTPLDTFLAPAPVELPCPAGLARPALLARRRVPRGGEEVRRRTRRVISIGLLYLCNKTLADYPQAVGTRRASARPATAPSTGRSASTASPGHMHLRGFDIRIELNPGTPSAQTLLHIPHWEFHWQDAYYLEQPVDASPATRSASAAASTTRRARSRS